VERRLRAILIENEGIHQSAFDEDNTLVDSEEDVIKNDPDF